MGAYDSEQQSVRDCGGYEFPCRASARSAWCMRAGPHPAADRAGPARDSSPPPDPPQIFSRNCSPRYKPAQIFPDGKAFPDAVPKAKPDDILREYRADQPDSPASLKRFIEAHFALPAPAAAPSLPDQVPIAAHIDGLWDVLTRHPTVGAALFIAVGLPQPYVVPGGRFREMYYWDSYFTMLGLAGERPAGSGGGHGARFRLLDRHLRARPERRAHLLPQPLATAVFLCNGRLDVAQGPGRAPIAPTCRSCGASMPSGWRARRRSKPATPHRRVVAMPDGSVLNRYWDDRDTPRDEAYREDTELARASKRPAPQLFRDIRAAAESGWDFGSRWFADGRTARDHRHH